MDEKEKIIIEIDQDEQDQEQIKKKTIRVLSFSLGKENYCVDIRQVKEVVKVMQTTRVPNAPEFIAGIMNLRGEVIVCINIGYLFSIEQRERTKDARAIVSDITGETMAMLVDKVEQTKDIEEELIQPPLATISEKIAQYTKGQIQIAEKIFAFLDIAKVLSCEEIVKLKKGEEV